MVLRTGLVQMLKNTSFGHEFRVLWQRQHIIQQAMNSAGEEPVARCPCALAVLWHRSTHFSVLPPRWTLHASEIVLGTLLDQAGCLFSLLTPAAESIYRGLHGSAEIAEAYSRSCSSPTCRLLRQTPSAVPWRPISSFLWLLA